MSKHKHSLWHSEELYDRIGASSHTNVELTLTVKAESGLHNWTPVNSRLLSIYFEDLLQIRELDDFCFVCVGALYSPTECSQDTVKDVFRKQLHNRLRKVTDRNSETDSRFECPNWSPRSRGAKAWMPMPALFVGSADCFIDTHDCLLLSGTKPVVVLDTQSQDNRHLLISVWHICQSHKLLPVWLIQVV